MIFKKYIYLTILLAMYSLLPVMASNEGDAVVVETRDGSLSIFVFTDKPVISFDGKNLTINTKTATLFDFGVVKKVYFEDQVAADVDNLLQEAKPTFHFVDRETIVISGVDVASHVSLYTLDGKNIPVDARIVNDEVTLSLSGLHSGVYIIKTNSHSFKFNKK